MHGWGIAQKLNVISNDAVQLQEGTLCHMKAKAWIEAEWTASENNRRAKYYRLIAVVVQIIEKA